jgi:hypothetical protein
MANSIYTRISTTLTDITQDAGDENWVTFLVAVTDPTDVDDEDEGDE